MRREFTRWLRQRRLQVLFGLNPTRTRFVDLEKESFQQILNADGLGRRSHVFHVGNVTEPSQQSRDVNSIHRPQTSSASALPQASSLNLSPASSKYSG
jgi:hypothetical protein